MANGELPATKQRLVQTVILEKCELIAIPVHLGLVTHRPCSRRRARWFWSGPVWWISSAPHAGPRTGSGCLRAYPPWASAGRTSR